MSIKDNQTEQILSGVNLVSFIKISRLNNDVKINNHNVSNNLLFNSTIELENFQNFKEGDILIFNNFDSYIEIKANKEKKFPLPSKIKVIKNENYLYKIKKSIKIINNEEDDFFVKLIGINNKNIKIEVIGDSQDFFYNNLGNNVSCDIGFEFSITPAIEKIDGNKVIIKSEIELKDKKNIKELNEIIEETKEFEKRKLFLNTLMDFENETLFI